MSATRVAQVRAILDATYPYRVRDKQIRRVLAVLPVPRARYRRRLLHFAAAVVALPYRLTA
jgi:hypothetical protein